MSFQPKGDALHTLLRRFVHPAVLCTIDHAASSAMRVELAATVHANPFFGGERGRQLWMLVIDAKLQVSAAGLDCRAGLHRVVSLTCHSLSDSHAPLACPPALRSVPRQSPSRLRDGRRQGGTEAVDDSETLLEQLLCSNDGTGSSSGTPDGARAGDATPMSTESAAADDQGGMHLASRRARACSALFGELIVSVSSMLKRLDLGATMCAIEPENGAESEGKAADGDGAAATTERAQGDDSGNAAGAAHSANGDTSGDGGEGEGVTLPTSAANAVATNPSDVHLFLSITEFCDVLLRSVRVALPPCSTAIHQAPRPLGDMLVALHENDAVFGMTQISVLPAPRLSSAALPRPHPWSYPRMRLPPAPPPSLSPPPYLLPSAGSCLTAPHVDTRRTPRPRLALWAVSTRLWLLQAHSHPHERR